MILLMDLDEVFCDFTSGALTAHGWTREELEAKRKPGQWDLCKPLKKTFDQFWEPIHELEPDFWLILPPLPWASDLKNYINSLRIEWYIISSPSRHPGCHSAKVRWCRRFFGKDFPNPIVTPHKELLACKDKLLVDDCEDNLTRFKARGGNTQLFPSMGNKLNYVANDPLPTFKEQLEWNVNSLQ